MKSLFLELLEFWKSGNVGLWSETEVARNQTITTENTSLQWSTQLSLLMTETEWRTKPPKQRGQSWMWKQRKRKTHTPNTLEAMRWHWGVEGLNNLEISVCCLPQYKSVCACIRVLWSTGKVYWLPGQTPAASATLSWLPEDEWMLELNNAKNTCTQKCNNRFLTILSPVFELLGLWQQLDQLMWIITSSDSFHLVSWQVTSGSTFDSRVSSWVLSVKTDRLLLYLIQMLKSRMHPKRHSAAWENT